MCIINHVCVYMQEIYYTFQVFLYLTNNLRNEIRKQNIKLQNKRLSVQMIHSKYNRIQYQHAAIKRSVQTQIGRLSRRR